MPLSTTIPRRPLFAAESLKRFVPDLRDARYFQIFGQALILAIGLFAREFQISALQMAAVAATCLAAQWFGSFLNAIRFDWKSAAITALSLSLLLRSDHLWPLMAAAAIGIGSKFAIRRQGASEEHAQRRDTEPHEMHARYDRIENKEHYRQYEPVPRPETHEYFSDCSHDRPSSRYLSQALYLPTWKNP